MMRKDLFEILLKNQHTLHCHRPTESTIIFLGVFLEEGGRCCAVTAVRYFADGIKARGQQEDFKLSTLSD
jgi:hypothetical protein